MAPVAGTTSVDPAHTPGARLHRDHPTLWAASAPRTVRVPPAAGPAAEASGSGRAVRILRGSPQRSRFRTGEEASVKRQPRKPSEQEQERAPDPLGSCQQPQGPGSPTACPLPGLGGRRLAHHPGAAGGFLGSADGLAWVQCHCGTDINNVHALAPGERGRSRCPASSGVRPAQGRVPGTTRCCGDRPGRVGRGRRGPVQPGVRRGRRTESSRVGSGLT